MVTFHFPDCGDLSRPDNGDYTLTGTFFEDDVTYTCDAGYELNGSPYRVCQFDGTWSGNDPSCTRKSKVLLFKIIVMSIFVLK